jgi:hypothetical protein
VRVFCSNLEALGEEEEKEEEEGKGAEKTTKAKKKKSLTPPMTSRESRSCFPPFSAPATGHLCDYVVVCGDPEALDGPSTPLGEIF